MPSPSGWGRSDSRTRGSTRATSRRRGSRAGSRSGAGRSRRAPSSSSAPVRSSEELRALAADGVQSLLLEGGPTLARAFLDAGLVDKLLLFVAPTLAGDGPFAVPGLAGPLRLTHLTSRQVGEDVLLEAYLREP